MTILVDTPEVAAPPWYEDLVTAPGGSPPEPPEPSPEPHRWEDDNRILLILLGVQVCVFVVSVAISILERRGYVDSRLAFLPELS